MATDDNPPGLLHRGLGGGLPPRAQLALQEELQLPRPGSGVAYCSVLEYAIA